MASMQQQQQGDIGFMPRPGGTGYTPGPAASPIVSIADKPTGLTPSAKRPVDPSTIQVAAGAPTTMTNEDLSQAFHNVNIQQMKGEIMALQAASTSSAAAGTDAGTMKIAAAVGEAVAKAMDGGAAPREHVGDWAGVTGSRLFTARVKEYSGATSSTTFGAWAATFKANIPKDMRDAIE